LSSSSEPSGYELVPLREDLDFTLLPQSKSGQSIADPCNCTRHRTAVTSESSSARARIPAGSRARCLFNVLISEAGKKILPISRDLIGGTQIGNPGFNGGSNEGKIDQSLSGGWPQSDHSGMQVLKHSDDGCSCGREPGNGPRLACASGLAREVSASA